MSRAWILFVLSFPFATLSAQNTPLALTGTLITPNGIVQNGTVLIQNGRIDRETQPGEDAGAEVHVVQFCCYGIGNSTEVALRQQGRRLGTAGRVWPIVPSVVVDDHFGIPTRRSIRTKPPSLRPASSPKPSPTSNASASPPAVCSPTMAPASMPITSLTPAAISASPTSAPASTPHAPTARPNASSRPPSAKGFSPAKYQRVTRGFSPGPLVRPATDELFPHPL